jgi:hypothetical protein
MHFTFPIRQTTQFDRNMPVLLSITDIYIEITFRLSDDNQLNDI